jgi:Immunity protein 22
MEKQGYVSLWIGNIQNEAQLSDYLELIYTDEGDFQPSQFLRDFNIDMDDIDEDFIEKVVYHENCKKIKDLLHGCSYDDVVIPRFEAEVGSELPVNINAAILLYNFIYQGDRQDGIHNDGGFRYIGSVSYS